MNKLSDMTGLDGSPFTTVHNFFMSVCPVNLTDAGAFLDQALANGMKVMMGVSCNPIDSRLSLPVVNAFKNHPAVAS